MFVALTEKSLRSLSVYGKSVSRVMLIFVLRVGFADGGVSWIPDLVVVIVDRLRALATVWSLIVIDVESV